MNLDFWTRTSGTWINIIAILVGTTFGLLLQNRLPQKMQQILTQALGLLTIWIGVTMADSLNQAQGGKIDGIILGLLALTMGGILGEALQIEDRLAAIGDWLQRRFRSKGRFTEGFVASSLLFCVGSLAVLGSLNNGLTGDNTLLVLKAVMDAIASIALTSSYGIGVGFSTLSILLYQGSISLAAGSLANFIPDPQTDPRIFLVTGVGGLTILGLGLNLLEVTRIRIASFLPAIALAPFIYWLGDRLS
ncbi:DUF554 domain-containing protein [Spirulina sp. 06S082]|uniref:DUF554 domain-containing protein n=1 Tax=Spirulina sp. 06S082 TaxID=3110248 RepID=UPI002B2038C4|nr:DUF554 domain-containing protein [Spirulina sp. 06S082]MEA5472525.1 DUF554 domain-containing protein [Spirulina sp. 06S082]